ncbi:MAG: ribonuclease P protein subunit [Nanoarchaeota archaeon]
MRRYTGILIGRQARVIAAKNPALLKLNGKIVDETKMTLKIKHDGKIKTLLKSSLTLQVDGLLLPGKELIGRTEERIQ